MFGCLSFGHYLFKVHSFPRATLSENCLLLRTDNFRGKISEHIFAPNGGYCVNYPSNIFATPAFLGHIQSRDAFRPIARERKYLMDFGYSLSICLVKFTCFVNRSSYLLGTYCSRKFHTPPVKSHSPLQRLGRSSSSEAGRGGE